MSEKKTGNAFWPPADSIEAAKKLTRYGVGAALFSAVITGLAAAWSLGANRAALGFVGPLAFIDVILDCAVAFGIYKQSRAAAVFGLVLFLYNKGYQIAATGELQGAWMAIILVLCYVHAIRGTYALRRLRQLVASTPTENPHATT